jgi:uncharacterized membrane protein YccF (DUF307 family)
MLGSGLVTIVPAIGVVQLCASTNFAAYALIPSPAHLLDDFDTNGVFLSDEEAEEVIVHGPRVSSNCCKRLRCLQLTRFSLRSQVLLVHKVFWSLLRGIWLVLIPVRAR